MRKTVLNRVSSGVVIILLASGIGFALFRSSGEAPPAMNGEEIFKRDCAMCHAVDTPEMKMGPGLENLFGKEALPVSGRPVTEENIKLQMKTPVGSMPSFAESLSEEEMDALVAYLKTI
jgi:cytochrome c2